MTLLILLPIWACGQAPQQVNVKLANAVADSNFRIEYVITDKQIPGYLNIHIRLLLADTIPNLKYIEDSLQFTEVSGRGKSFKSAGVQKVTPKQFDVVTVLLDVSSSMWRQDKGKFVHMDSAKVIVDSILGVMSAPYASRIYTYDEQLYNRTLSGENSVKYVAKPLDARYTHLWENIDAAISRMPTDSGFRKILIVVGDGENDQNPKKPIGITKDSVLTRIRGLSSDYVIFPISIGSNVYAENLRDLVAATQNTSDSVATSKRLGTGVFKFVQEIKRWPFTHKMVIKSEVHPHAGEERQIVARLESVSDTATYRLGGLFNPWHEETTWQLDVFLGGTLLIALFAIFAFVVPARRWKDFKTKYVRQYWEVKKDGERKYDPLTKFPFRDEDFVVVRCEHMTSLETWQYEGRSSGKSGNNRKRKNRCIYYPRQCESGQGPGGAADFFNQKGVFKQLFWVFVGAIGGFLGWGIWGMFETAKKIDWHEKLDKFAIRPDMQEQWGISSIIGPPEDSIRIIRERFLDAFFEQIVLGAVATLFIVFLISIANEVAQAKSGFRGLQLLYGILRALAKAVVAGVIGAALFMGFGLLQSYVFTKSPYLPGLLTMLLLGLFTGRILTIRSGIRPIRGVLAGLAAGFIAFHIYFLPMLVFGAKGYELTKLLMLITFGGVLGLIMSQGAPALEASEMEVWTGFKRYGKSHITDLLRKNEEVTVGRGPTATIRIKVKHTPAHNAPGNVVQTFARLTMRNEVVYLEPDVFTEVNGEAVAPNEKVPLFHGDKIAFSHKSPSHLRYVEHRAGMHPRWRAKKRRDKRARRIRAKALAMRVRARSKQVKTDEK